MHHVNIASVHIGWSDVSCPVKPTLLSSEALPTIYTTMRLIKGFPAQKPRESEGLGRQDSSGHLTLHLMPSSTTQLLAATQTAVPGRPSPGGVLGLPCA